MEERGGGEIEFKRKKNGHRKDEKYRCREKRTQTNPIVELIEMEVHSRRNEHYLAKPPDLKPNRPFRLQCFLC